MCIADKSALQAGALKLVSTKVSDFRRDQLQRVRVQFIAYALHTPQQNL